MIVTMPEQPVADNQSLPSPLIMSTNLPLASTHEDGSVAPRGNLPVESPIFGISTVVFLRHGPLILGLGEHLVIAQTPCQFYSSTMSAK
jgi:hypothetical protein